MDARGGRHSPARQTRRMGRAPRLRRRRARRPTIAQRPSNRDAATCSPSGSQQATAAAKHDEHAKDRRRRRQGAASARERYASADHHRAAREPRAAPMLLDAAFLVPRGKAARFRVGRGAAKKIAPAGFALQVTGPWPPYSFVEQEPDGETQTAARKAAAQTSISSSTRRRRDAARHARSAPEQRRRGRRRRRAGRRWRRSRLLAIVELFSARSIGCSPDGPARSVATTADHAGCGDPDEATNTTRLVARGQKKNEAQEGSEHAGARDALEP